MSILDYFGVERRTPQGRSDTERLARDQAFIDAARARELVVQYDSRVRQPTTVVSQGFTRQGRGGLSGPYTPYTESTPVGNLKGSPALDATTKQENLRQNLIAPPVPAWMQDLLNTTEKSGGVSFRPIAPPVPASFVSSVVDRNLYLLEESAAEAQALADARADIDARARAGAQAVANTWQTVQETNRAAAEKSLLLAQQYGSSAAGLWTDAANQAREASVLRAAAAMANAGRSFIDLDPLAGSEDFIAAMESLAIPEGERAYAEGIMQAKRSEDFAAMAGRQSAAYQGELKRTSIIMAVDMAKEHNARVFERIGRERLALSDAERQTDLFNRQLQAQIERENIERQFTANQFNEQQRMDAQQFNAQMRQTAERSRSTLSARLLKDTQEAWVLRDPMLLVNEYGMSLREANERIENYDLSITEESSRKRGGLGAPPVTGFSSNGTS